MTGTSCFFCQNLLSDFMEGILPVARHDELRSHLTSCEKCKTAHKDLLLTMDVLKGFPTPILAHEAALRITEASQAGSKRFVTRARLSRASLLLAFPLLVVIGLSLAFPTLFPLKEWLGHGKDDAHFSRYYPLLQGAAEIIEEQAGWLHDRDSVKGSVWEEGGLSPEEFEKAFQIKGAKEDEK